MKILWLSNAPWVGSGYGQQTSIWTRKLKEAGHHVDILSNYGLNGSRMVWEGMTVYPPHWDSWGNDIIELYLAELKPDIVITLCDAWILKDEWALVRGMRWVPYVPIDHEPLAENIAQRLRTAFHVLPFGPHGAKMLKEAGISNYSIVPHGIDTEVFRPLAGVAKLEDGTVLDRAWFKSHVQAQEDTFVIGMVAANRGGRKNIHRVIAAFAKFNKEVSNSRLVLHTASTSPDGIDLIKYANIHGITDNLSLTPTLRYVLGLTPPEMAALYNAFDILANPSSGEGFGLPIVEAQACGIPVITTNFSAMPEVTGVGRVIEPVSHDLVGAPHWMHQATVKDDDILEAMFSLYRDWLDKEKWAEMQKQAREFALQFHIETIWQNFWMPALEKIQSMIQTHTDVGKWLA